MDKQEKLPPKKYLQGLRKLFPEIRPYDEDDLDWAWCDEGYQFLEACDFGMAELTFQRVIAARPNDPDGFEGLAMVYKTLGHKYEAVILIDEAVRLAKKKFAQEYLDEEAMREIALNQRYIHEMEE